MISHPLLIALLALLASVATASADAFFVIDARIRSPHGTYRVSGARIDACADRTVVNVRSPRNYTIPAVAGPVTLGYDGKRPVAKVELWFRDYSTSAVNRVTLGGYGSGSRVRGNVAGAGFKGTFTLTLRKESSK